MAKSKYNINAGAAHFVKMITRLYTLDQLPGLRFTMVKGDDYIDIMPGGNGDFEIPELAGTDTEKIVDLTLYVASSLRSFINKDCAKAVMTTMTPEQRQARAKKASDAALKKRDATNASTE